MKITDLSILFKWEILKNLQCISNTYLPHFNSECIRLKEKNSYTPKMA